MMNLSSNWYFVLISCARMLMLFLSTVPTKQDIFPPESLLKKTKAKKDLSEKAAIEKAAAKKVCFFF
jgi:hypothetical protein